MDVTTAILCDFAQVREGLLFVASGGVSAMWRDSFPAPFGVCLALVIEMDSIEGQRPHALEVFILDQDGGEAAALKAGLQAIQPPSGTSVIQAPLSIDLRAVGLPTPGPYEIRVYLDGQHRRTLHTNVNLGPPPDPAAPGGDRQAQAGD